MPVLAPADRRSKRLAFGRAHDLVDLPDLIEVQRDSYRWFFQFDAEATLRRSAGLQELFEEIFPIESYDGSFALEFVSYHIDPATTSE